MLISFGAGGGYCHTEMSCKERSMSSLGSSKHWPSTMTGDSLISSDPEENKDFYSWNHVFIPVSLFVVIHFTIL